MPNETAINRLLYAILSQKCLKDIDWNKVANDPVLKKEITNGHAARMRYSRFKKQMEGTSGVSRKPRNPNTPRKNKPKKSVKPEKPATLPEYLGEEHTERTRPVRDDNEDYAAAGEMSVAGPRVIKREPAERETKFMPGTPFTPQSYNSTPSPGTSQHNFGFMGSDLGDMDPMDNMATSFGYVGDGLYSTMIRQESYGSGMGVQMNAPHHYDQMWQQHDMIGLEARSERQMVDEEGVPVKTEQRWDAAYRHP